jgi:hypothetical protein
MYRKGDRRGFRQNVGVRRGRRPFIATAVPCGGTVAAATVAPGTSDNVRLAAAKTGPAMITPFPGFLLSDGRFTTIDVPAGARTQVLAAGINDLGTVVGDFDDADGTHHGYVRDSGGGFSAINGKGQPAGRYSLVSPYSGDPAGNSQQHSVVGVDVFRQFAGRGPVYPAHRQSKAAATNAARVDWVIDP